MSAIVACSITVLALIGQAVEEARRGADVQGMGLQALTGALAPVEVQADSSWFETVRIEIQHELR